MCSRLFPRVLALGRKGVRGETGKPRALGGFPGVPPRACRFPRAAGAARYARGPHGARLPGCLSPVIRCGGDRGPRFPWSLVRRGPSLSCGEAGTRRTVPASAGAVLYRALCGHRAGGVRGAGLPGAPRAGVAARGFRATPGRPVPAGHHLRSWGCGPDMVAGRHQGFRPTPQNASISAGGVPPRELTGGRHRGQETTPGSTRSSPSKNRAISSGLRRQYGSAPLSL